MRIQTIQPNASTTTAVPATPKHLAGAGFPLLVVGVLALLGRVAPADQPADVAPATQPSQQARAQAPDPAQEFQAEAVSVTGVAQYRNAADPDGKWTKLASGDVLGQSMILRTGLGAEVVLQFGDRGQVTVRSATKIGIAQLAKDGTALRTKLGMKYGSVRATVDSTKGLHDFQVSTPVATLSVRGSEAGIGSSDFGLGLDVTAGNWPMNPGAGGQNGTAGPGQVFLMGPGYGFLTNSQYNTLLGLLLAGGGDAFGMTGNEMGMNTGNTGNGILAFLGNQPILLPPGVSIPPQLSPLFSLPCGSGDINQLDDPFKLGGEESGGGELIICPPPNGR